MPDDTTPQAPDVLSEHKQIAESALKDLQSELQAAVTPEGQTENPQEDATDPRTALTDLGTEGRAAVEAGDVAALEEVERRASEAYDKEHANVETLLGTLRKDLAEKEEKYTAGKDGVTEADVQAATAAVQQWEAYQADFEKVAGPVLNFLANDLETLKKSRVPAEQKPSIAEPEAHVPAAAPVVEKKPMTAQEHLADALARIERVLREAGEAAADRVREQEAADRKAKLDQDLASPQS